MAEEKPKTRADMENERYEQRFAEIVKQQIDALPEECRQKRGPYVCYCLRSVVAPRRTYCGSTNDLVHRIRQHNGVIKGGARMTSTTQPWRVAAVVYGFKDQHDALRFEYFTKMKHSRKAFSAAMKRGANSIQRRSAMLLAAEQKMAVAERERLKYYLPDEFLAKCLAEARASGVCKTLTIPDMLKTK
jgi:predicted GIY-YIG superfamily endonuclease